MTLLQHFKRLLLTTLCLTCAFCVKAQHFVGGDISMLPYYETAGSTYLDNNGNAISGDLIDYLKQQGWNSLRVRLFVDPVAYRTKNGSTFWNEGARQTLDDVTTLGKRIKDAGLAFMLDLHYSDTWTDPGKHLAPLGWNSSNLATELYNYTKTVLQTLKGAGATPDFIQVGNELNCGMLWDKLYEGEASNSCYANTTGAKMDNFISYLKKGCQACREECPDAKIVFHVAMEYKTTANAASWAAKTWPQTLADKGVDYDIIGLSYYPAEHGPLNYLTTLLTYLTGHFPDKQVQLVETGYPHAYYPGGANYNYTSTYPATDDGQLAFTTALLAELKKFPRVTGLYWWFPEANEYWKKNTNTQVTSGWYNNGLWDNQTGKAMKALYQLKNFRGDELTAVSRPSVSAPTTIAYSLHGYAASVRSRGLHIVGGRKVISK